MQITSIIKQLDDKYVNTPIIIFGDLNCKRKDVKKKFDLENRGFKFIYDEDENAITRYQETKNGIETNYLDYFITKNVKNVKLTIEDPIGNSDHKTLRLDVFDTDMRIERRLKLAYSMKKVKNESEYISKALLSCITEGDNKCDNLLELIKFLRKRYKPLPVRLKSNFKMIKDLKEDEDWETIGKLIKRTNTDNYFTFLEHLKKLKTNNLMMQYFLKLRFFSELNSKTGILSDFLIDHKEYGTIVTTDKFVINDIVTDKYSKLFRGIDRKNLIPLIQPGDSYIYTKEDVREALINLNLSKATGWDFIPGIAYREFIRNDRAITGLTELLNEISAYPLLPHEISTGRLICLNKNQPEPGIVDALRPITVTGIISKLLEYPLLRELKKVRFNMCQLGFRERLSTEMNIMRLLDRVEYLKNSNRKITQKGKEVYVVYLDLKQAFDSVNHAILTRKLLERGVDHKVVNSLIKQMNSTYMSLDLINYIIVNRGVGQGKLTSPILFNIYIDDLLDELEKIVDTVLAFADDTCFVCDDYNKLVKAINVIEKWCKANDIELNKNKSGIVIINDQGNRRPVSGIPIVEDYRYLGVLLNNSMKPAKHITGICDKVKVYLERYSWLKRTYFTPNGLMVLIEYFIKSRLLYGMSLFIDTQKNIYRLDKCMMSHMKTILGCKYNTSHEKLRLMVGEPEIKIRLALRLLKTYHKFIQHFNYEPMKFKRMLKSYFDDEDIDDININYSALSSNMINANLSEIFDRNFGNFNMKLRRNHRGFVRKYIFSSWNIKDYYFLKYIGKTCRATNDRLFPICKCGKNNITGHVANHCLEVMTRQLRNKYKTKLDELYRKMNKFTRKSLHEYILHGLFVLNGKDEKTIRKVISTLRKIVFVCVTKAGIDRVKEAH